MDAMASKTSSATSLADRRVRDWILQNRGVMVEIARASVPKVTPQFVQMIAYQRRGAKSAGLRIEKKLAARGCPGIKV